MLRNPASIYEDPLVSHSLVLFYGLSIWDLEGIRRDTDILLSNTDILLSRTHSETGVTHISGSVWKALILYF